MEQMYGTDLFNRLRPDWRTAQAGVIDFLCNADDKVRYVADVDGSVVGFAVASLGENVGLGSIDTVAVQPSSQRRGIGSALIQQLLADLAESGMSYAQAYIRDFPGHEPVRRALEDTGFASMSMQPFPYYLKLQGRESGSSESPNIRRINSDDVQRCVRLGTDTFKHVYASFEQQHGPDLFAHMFPNWEATQASYMESACLDADKETWVYEDHGEVAGFAILTTDEQKLGEIELLAVDPQTQGRGIGTALNQFSLDRLQGLGMEYAIVATADDPGHASARRSYEKVGFVPMPIQWNFQYIQL